MKTGIPAIILAERLDMLLTLAKMRMDAGQPVGPTIIEAQDVLNQLKGAL